MQSPPEPLPVTIVVPPEDELALELLTERPSLDRTVTDGPPVVELCTPLGPAVTLLDTEPSELRVRPSEPTTRQGWSPLRRVVVPEPGTVVVLDRLPFGPAVTLLLWARTGAAPSSSAVPNRNAKRLIGFSS